MGGRLKYRPDMKPYRLHLRGSSLPYASGSLSVLQAVSNSYRLCRPSYTKRSPSQQQGQRLA